MKQTIESVKRLEIIGWILFGMALVVGFGLHSYIAYASTFIGLLFAVSATFTMRKANKMRKSLQPAN